MIRAFFALIFVNILCAQNIAESSAESNANSIKNPLDSAIFAESSANVNIDSADSTNPPPSRKSQNLKALLSDISR